MLRNLVQNSKKKKKNLQMLHLFYQLSVIPKIIQSWKLGFSSKEIVAKDDNVSVRSLLYTHFYFRQFLLYPPKAHQDLDFISVYTFLFIHFFLELGFVPKQRATSCQKCSKKPQTFSSSLRSSPGRAGVMDCFRHQGSIKLQVGLGELEARQFLFNLHVNLVLAAEVVTTRHLKSFQGKMPFSDPWSHSCHSGPQRRWNLTLDCACLFFHLSCTRSPLMSSQVSYMASWLSKEAQGNASLFKYQLVFLKVPPYSKVTP